MITREARIEAARCFAPPLVTVGQVDRRGARLHFINGRAVAYTQSAGLSLEEVYPGAMRALRMLAPPAGSPEAAPFAREVGVPVGDLYPLTVDFGQEPQNKRSWGWKWAIVGALLGAAAFGPAGSAVIGVAGGLIGGAAR